MRMALLFASNKQIIQPVVLAKELVMEELRANQWQLNMILMKMLLEIQIIIILHLTIMEFCMMKTDIRSFKMHSLTLMQPF